MKKTFACMLLCLLVALFVGVQLVKEANANPYASGAYPVTGNQVDPPGAAPPVMTIVAPRNETRCATTNITFAFTLTEPYSLPYGFRLRTFQIYYTPDWERRTIRAIIYPNFSSSPGVFDPRIGFFNSSFIMPNVPDGNHSVQLVLEGRFETDVTEIAVHTAVYDCYVRSSSQVICFSVDTIPPEISNLKAENDSSQQNINVTFATNESTSWIGYSLDSAENETVNGNFSLTYLPEGTHRLTVCSNDTYGNTGKSDTLFLVFTEAPTPTPSPAVDREFESLPCENIVAVFLLVALSLAVAVLIFRSQKKTRRKRS
jgi:hypothetical protein